MRENRAEYVVTYYGRPVAVLLPVDDEWLEEEVRRVAEAAAPGEDVRAERRPCGKRSTRAGSQRRRPWSWSPSSVARTSSTPAST